MRDIIVDFLTVAMSLGLLFNSLWLITKVQYAGSPGYGNQSMVVPGVLLLIFTLSMCRLVVDLRRMATGKNGGA